jgi:hypothetical protein
VIVGGLSGTGELWLGMADRAGAGLQWRALAGMVVADGASNGRQGLGRHGRGRRGVQGLARARGGAQWLGRRGEQGRAMAGRGQAGMVVADMARNGAQRLAPAWQHWNGSGRALFNHHVPFMVNLASLFFQETHHGKQPSQSRW